MKSLTLLFVLVGFAVGQVTINFDLKTYLDKKFTDIEKKFTDIEKNFTDVEKNFTDVEKKIDGLKEDNQRLEDKMDKRFTEMEDKMEQKFSTLYTILTAIIVGFSAILFPFIFRSYRELFFEGGKKGAISKEDMEEIMEKIFKYQIPGNNYVTKEFLEKDLLSQLKKDLLSQLRKELQLEKGASF